MPGRTLATISTFAALFLIIAAAWLARSQLAQSVTAAEILARAASAPAVQSYQGVITGGNILQCNDPLLVSSEAGDLQKWQEKVWFQAPRSKQIQYSDVIYRGQDWVADPALASGQAGGSIPALGVPGPYIQRVSVTNGVKAWSMNGSAYSTQTVELWDPDEFDAYFSWWSGPVGYSVNTGQTGSFDLQNIVQTAAQDYKEVKLIGEETVARRSAYVLELAHSLRATLSDKISTRLWIDKETFLQIGYQMLVGSTVIHCAAFESIQINEPIDPRVFNGIPTGTLIDLRSKVPATPVDLTNAWNAIAQQVPYGVFVPSALPATFSPKLPLLKAGTQSPSLETTSANRIVWQSYHSKTSALALLIMEVGLFPDVTLRSGGQPVTIGGDVLEKGSYRDFGAMRVLMFWRANTVISLISSAELSQDDLVSIAKSMQEVAVVKPKP